MNKLAMINSCEIILGKKIYKNHCEIQMRAILVCVLYSKKYGIITCAKSLKFTPMKVGLRGRIHNPSFSSNIRMGPMIYSVCQWQASPANTSLLGTFVSYEENERLWIRPLVFSINSHCTSTLWERGPGLMFENNLTDWSFSRTLIKQLALNLMTWSLLCRQNIVSDKCLLVKYCEQPLSETTICIKQLYCEQW
jgi:hypothetical protein